jgi:hypothetical protein
MPEVDRLLQGHSTIRNWNLGQICSHLAGAFKGSVEGFPMRPPWIIRVLFGKVAKTKILGSGKMAEGIKLPEAVLPKPGLDARAEAEALRAAVAYYVDHPEKRAPHPMFGQMTGPEWDLLHRIHCAHHLSFVLPT